MYVLSYLEYLKMAGAQKVRYTKAGRIRWYNVFKKTPILEFNCITLLLLWRFSVRAKFNDNSRKNRRVEKIEW